jgi:hypothetical protein
MLKQNNIQGGQNKGFWGWLKRNSSIILPLLGAALGGPVGAGIGSLLAAWITTRSSGQQIPSHLEPIIEQWSDDVLQPYLLWALPRINGISPHYSSSVYASNFNQISKDLSALRAYYEFRRSISTNQDDVILYTEKAWGIGNYLDVITTAFNQASTFSNPYGFVTQPFNALLFESVGYEDFNWAGASTVTANFQKLQLKSEGGTTDPVIVTPGGITPGGITPVGSTPVGSTPGLITAGPIKPGVTNPTFPPTLPPTLPPSTSTPVSINPFETIIDDPMVQTPPFNPINTPINTPPFNPINTPINTPVATPVPTRPFDNTSIREVVSKNSKYIALAGAALIAYLLLKTKK